MVMWLIDQCHLSLGTSWVVALGGLPLACAQAKIRHGFGDGVDDDVRGKKDQIIVHSCAGEL
jgi:hypothetical protein